MHLIRNIIINKTMHWIDINIIITLYFYWLYFKNFVTYNIILANYDKDIIDCLNIIQYNHTNFLQIMIYYSLVLSLAYTFLT